MKKKYYLVALLLSTLLTAPVHAQRIMDKLDRGLVAVKTTDGVYCSWRINAEEYFDVKYNLYRDGVKVNSEPLDVSNYTDASGSSSSTYTVKAVVDGKEQDASKAAKVITGDGKSYGVLTVKRPKRVSVSDGTTDITDNFEPNDATIADVDGDGEMELLVKQISKADNAGYQGPDYDRIEVQKLDGTLLWWIDCGPNLWDFQHNETNIAAYDWDGDGKAECIMRAADGTTIHTADGKTIVIGDSTKKYRYSGEQFVHEGAEYLLYLNGQTGEPYQIGPSAHPSYMDYPLKRLEDGETDLAKAWGDGYGHRSSKNFFGAPYLDGRKPSIFMARGIYTRHKMIAMDVDPATHKLSTRWRWNCNTPGSKWYGQGYHNYAVADVDWDGRDEIVFGSMVIDDNGKGLSTTGLGHGDAEHVGNYNPYVHGQEIFACNEDNPANNYRDATTSTIYHRLAGGGDDGRSMMGNFSNKYPGAIGASGHDNPISSITNDYISGLTTKPSLNFRIYWDGDLLDENLNYSNGKNTAFSVWKYDGSKSWTLDSSISNNDTKGTPCFQGDIFGDWREEVVARTASGDINIYTSAIPTTYRIPTLLSDKQYRNAMVWQMNGYNQPPAVSYFIGELEGITVAPPVETNNGREEVANGGTVSASLNGKTALMAETNDMTVSVADGAAPKVFVDNAPSWVQGNDDNAKIAYTYYTHTLTDGAFGGATHVVKQGDGILVMPKVTETYSGKTDVWAGTLSFDGVMQNSPVWLNRLTTLNSNGGEFRKGIKADYGATINVGGTEKKGTLRTTTLHLGFGSILSFKLYNDSTCDHLEADSLTLEKKNWQYGPKYDAPVININVQGDGPVKAGRYELAKVGTLIGDLSSVTVTGISGVKATLEYNDGKLDLVIPEMRSAAAMEWSGSEDGTWDMADKRNFTGSDGAADIFVSGDDVTFNDKATTTDVTVVGNVAPKSITFDNTKTYTLSGDSIVGNPTLTKNNTGETIINNVNHLGNTIVNGGKLTVSTLANEIGQAYGALGDVDKTITVTNGAALKISAANTVAQRIYITGEGTLETAGNVTMSRGFLGSGTLTKTGSGALNLSKSNILKKLVIAQGTVNAVTSSLPSTVEFGNNTTLVDPTNSQDDNANFVVPENVTASITGGPYTRYKGKLTGAGTLNFTNTGIRSSLAGDWSDFEGTIKFGMGKRGSYAATAVEIDNDYGYPQATFNVPSGVTVNNNYSKGGKHNVTVGSFTGAGTLGGSGTWILGTNDKDFVFGLASTSTLVKRGEGVMRIITVGKLSCPLRVEAGTLAWSESARSKRLLDANMLTVTGSGKVVANGLVQSVTLTGNGQLTPSSSVFALDNPTGIGVLKTSSMFKAENNGTVVFLLKANGQSSKIEAGGDLTLGKIDVKLVGGYVPQNGDSFTLWTCNNLRKAPTDISLPMLPTGLYWDTTGLAAGNTTGVLKVTDVSTGIRDIEADGTAVETNVYTLDGRKVMTVRVGRNVVQSLREAGCPQGVYIVNGKKITLK